MYTVGCVLSSSVLLLQLICDSCQSFMSLQDCLHVIFKASSICVFTYRAVDRLEFVFR